jgi:hypothetical protein
VLESSSVISTRKRLMKHAREEGVAGQRARRG